MLRFGTSGIPRSSPRPGTVHGIARARALGLDCLEMAWVNGVRMSDATAETIAAAARAHRLALTAHAPYYVNLCGTDEIVRRSLDRLVETGRLAWRCGAKSFCFHAGFYQRHDPAEANRRVREGLEIVTRRLRDMGVTVDVRPELTGKPSQLGTLDEILGWCEAVEGVRPCVDFSHQYARHGGAYNRYEDFAAMLERIAQRLGKTALGRLHVHIAGILYGPKGERRHVPLRESKFCYRELLRALRDAGVSGWVVCESPAMEEDALRLKRAFARLA